LEEEESAPVRRGAHAVYQCMRRSGQVVYGTRSFVHALYWRMRRSRHAAYTKEEWLYDVWVHAEEWACGISYVVYRMRSIAHAV